MVPRSLLILVVVASLAAAADDFVCTLCPDGSEPNYPPNTVIGFTCESTEGSLFLLEEEDCLEIQTSDIPALCGCEGFTLPGVNGTCTLCPDGEAPSGEPLVDDETILGFESCADLDFFLQIGADDESCTEIEESAIPALCGCDIPGFVPCTFCPAGQVAVGNVNELTCEELAGVALLSGSAESEECTSLLADMANVCECVDIESCAGVCPDGSAPLAPNVPIADFGGATCAELDATIKADSLTAESEECSGFQFYAVTCECAGVVACGGLCDDGAAPGATDLEVPGSGFTCGFLDGLFQTELPDFNAECENLDLQVFCQCPGVEACAGVCPDGQAPLNTDPVFGEQTCQDLDLSASAFIPEGETCADLQEFRLICECPGVEPVCSLCEDGSTVPDPTLVIANTTCMELQFVFGLDDENCTIAQGVPGTYCGCSNPIANMDVCRLCGDGVLLPDPSLLVEGSDGSCGETEFESSFSVSDCASAREKYAPGCCGGIQVTPVPTSAPMTTQAPQPPTDPTTAPVEATPPPVSGGNSVLLVNFSVAAVIGILFVMTM